METNFSKLTKKATKLLFLVPSLICDINIDKTVFEDAINLYCDDLPNENVVDIEIRMWKRKWCAVAFEQRPDSVAKALKLCDQENFPNLFVLLKLVATFPVTSCECERSFSTLRRLRSYLRASMSTTRLTSLALMNVNYGFKIDYKKVVRLFMTLCPRRVNVPNFIYEYS
jgi:hypothetical protein